MPNTIFIERQTPHVWRDAGGDSAMSLNGLASGSAQVGAEWDRGFDVVPAMFEWRLVVDGFASTVSVGTLVWVYFALSDGTDRDGDLPATNSAVTNANKLFNLIRADNLRVEATTAATKHVASGHVWLPSRYISPVIENGANQAFSSTSNHTLTLTPVPDQIQDS